MRSNYFRVSDTTYIKHGTGHKQNQIFNSRDYMNWSAKVLKLWDRPTTEPLIYTEKKTEKLQSSSCQDITRFAPRSHCN